MKRETKNILRTTLTQAINEWWDKLELDEPLPYVGDNIAELMASAAVAVLLGVADAQDFLYQEGFIREEE